MTCKLFLILFLFSTLVFSQEISTCNEFYAERAFGELTNTDLTAIQSQLPPETEKIKWKILPNGEINLPQTYEAYKKSYQDIGLKINSPEGLKKYPYFIVAQAPDNTVPVFLGLTRTSHGLKVGVMGTDDSSYGKLLFLKLLNKGLPQSVYSEVSLGIASLADRLNLPIVPQEYAIKIMNDAGKSVRKPSPVEIKKAIEMNMIPDKPAFIDNAYIHTMTINGMPMDIVKVMIGSPLP